uniref:DH domain-containing protein n=1 Tax=Ditylenchus dipsaci TaxID=166011 RepID=A0A915DRD1_9BILA
MLAEFQNCSDSVADICRVLINQRNHFLSLYRPYCQNKPISEALRGGSSTDNHQPSDQCKFFVDCQRKAGHLLPLSAYLLKPIQRITKYQLLLKELLRFCPDNNRLDVQSALASMLDLLAQLNADMQQLHILGFAGDLRLLGPLRLQAECEVYGFKRKTRRLANKAQKRHLFLFDGGILFCKKRMQPVQYASEYYEHKLCIPMHSLGFAECSKSSADRFELWDDNRNDGYAIQTADEKMRAKWIERLSRLTVLHAQQVNGTVTDPSISQSFYAQSRPNNYANNQNGFALQQHQRPQSWTSESSNVSSRSSTSAVEDGSGLSTESFTSTSDANGNNPSSPTETNIPSSATLLLGRRLSTSTTTSGTFSDHENNPAEMSTTPMNNMGHVTNIQIPASKSLQNTHINLEMISSSDLHHASSYQLSAIAENKRHSELAAK